MRCLILYALFAFLTSACAEVEKLDIPDNNRQSTVSITEATSGVVVGSFQKGATNVQSLIASLSSNIKHVAVDIPPGSLNADLDMTLAEGKAQSSPNALPSELAISDTVIVGGSTPVYVNDNQSSDLNASAPGTLNIPLPLDEVVNTGSLTLADNTGKIAVLYVVRIAGVNKVGVRALTTAELKGAFAALKMLNFGWFRIVVLSKTVSDTEVNSTTIAFEKAL